MVYGVLPRGWKSLRCWRRERRFFWQRHFHQSAARQPPFRRNTLRANVQRDPTVRMAHQFLSRLNIDSQTPKTRCQAVPEGMPADHLVPDTSPKQGGSDDLLQHNTGDSGCFPFGRVEGKRKSQSASQGLSSAIPKVHQALVDGSEPAYCWPPSSHLQSGFEHKSDWPRFPLQGNSRPPRWGNQFGSTKPGRPQSTPSLAHGDSIQPEGFWNSSAVRTSGLSQSLGWVHTPVIGLTAIHWWRMPCEYKALIYVAGLCPWPSSQGQRNRANPQRQLCGPLRWSVRSVCTLLLRHGGKNANHSLFKGACVV